MCEKWRDRVRKRERGLHEERVRVERKILKE